MATVWPIRFTKYISFSTYQYADKEVPATMQRRCKKLHISPQSGEWCWHDEIQSTLILHKTALLFCWDITYFLKHTSTTMKFLQQFTNHSSLKRYTASKNTSLESNWRYLELFLFTAYCLQSIDHRYTRSECVVVSTGPQGEFVHSWVLTDYWVTNGEWANL